MLTFTSEHRLEEVRWMPNGDLIGLRAIPEPSSDSFEFFSFMTPVEVVLWSFPDFSETVLAETAVVRSRDSRSILRVGSTGEFVSVRGPANLCLRIKDRRVIDSVTRERLTQVAASPDGRRILFNSNQTTNGFLLMTEHCWLEEGRSYRSVLVSPTLIKEFFYSFEEDVLFCMRSDIATIEQMRIKMRIGNSSRQIVDFEAVAEKSFPVPRGEYKVRSRSLEGTVIVFEGKKLWITRFNDYFSIENTEGLWRGQEIGSLCIDPTNRNVVFCETISNSVVVYDLYNGVRIREFQWGPEQIHSVDCSHDGTMIAAVVGENKIIVWDVDY